MNVLNDLGLWFWRLLPANPILVRVVTTGGKRIRHLWARVGYLVVLFIVMLVVGNAALKPGSSSLCELAKGSTKTFMFVSMVQLFLMCFIAPVFTAAAITQEKDSNTFHILLTTPLSNAQIVLGTLLSRLYFVWVLLLAGLPIFCITMIFGGVTRVEIFESFGLAACTGLITGSIAIAISVIRVGTRKTIFSFFVGVAVYLLAMGWLGLSGYTEVTSAPPNMFAGAERKMSWLAPFHPFLALLAVTGQTPPPKPDDARVYGWPWAWMLAQPQYAYMTMTSLLSVVMVLLSMIFLRKGSKEGESNFFSRLKAVVVRKEAGERRQKPRHVWHNPIAWREAVTRGSAAGRSTMRYVFMGLGVLAGFVLLIAYNKGWWGLNPASVGTVRNVLIAIIWIELTIILLIVTNTAATTLTREKESQTIEILLATPLTSRFIIWGMLRGLVSFVIPMIAVPTFTLALFAFADLFRPSGAPHITTPEAVILAPLMMIAYAAVASLVGLYFSLNQKKTVQAVMYSTAAVMVPTLLLWGCGEMTATMNGHLNSLASPLLPFPSMQVFVDPESSFRKFTGNQAPSGSDLMTARGLRLAASLVAALIYAGITYSMYNSMVRGFDMTVRRQSA
jgi:ABC-type transport system involved in multi-copper enzyme maturation permease subunit